MTEISEQAWLDQEDAMVAQTIRKHGCFIQYVAADCCSAPGCTGEGGDPELPAFAYTVGLFGLGHPELVIVGVGGRTAAGVLNELAARVRAGENLLPGQLVTFDGWAHRATLEEVPNPGDIVFAANRHYQRPAECSVPALQVTFDDEQGRFPWDEGYALPPRLQPRPGTWEA